MLPAPTCRGRVPTIFGTTLADEIVGTGARDIIAALGGDDWIHGKAGNDLICGGAGNDTIDAGAGLKARIFPEDSDPLVMEQLVAALSRNRFDVKSLFVEQGRLDLEADVNASLRGWRVPPT